MNWEDRLRDALAENHQLTEDRRIHGHIGARSAATASRPQQRLAPYLLGLVAIVCAIGLAVGVSQLGGDETEQINVASNSPAGDGADADAGGSSAGESSTGPTPAPAVTPAPTATPVPPATLVPVPTPRPPATPVPAVEAAPIPINQNCPEDNSPANAIFDVVDVALDDPDGGLVVHSAPGVDAPETGVIAPWGIAFSTGACVLVGESRWVEVRTIVVSGGDQTGWVNARFLARSDEQPSLPDVQFVEIALGRPAQDITNIDYVERVTRWVPVSLASGEWPQFLLDLLEAGPTAAEREAGFQSELHDVSPREGCAGRRTRFVDQIGPGQRYIQMCAASAGIGTDARVESQVRQTLVGIGLEDIPMVIEGNYCWGDLSGEPCLPTDPN